MTEAKCSCDKFERLEGASVNAYSAAFLEAADDAGGARQKLFRCRACGRLWEKRAPEAKSARPSLVRIN